jgi:hypothetical protein
MDWRLYVAVDPQAVPRSESERADVSFALVESLDGTVEDAGLVVQAWQQEIEWREAQLERGEAKPIPGDEVMAKVRRRLG